MRHSNTLSSRFGREQALSILRQLEAGSEHELLSLILLAWNLPGVTSAESMFEKLPFNRKTAVEPALGSEVADTVGFPTAPRFTLRVRNRFFPIACRHGSWIQDGWLTAVFRFKRPNATSASNRTSPTPPATTSACAFDWSE